MLRVLPTLDYEIHGNGEGCPLRLMVEPTDRLLRQCERHGARLTIMADVAEIIRFRDHHAATGTDTFHAEAICRQLQSALARGHDVQLHLHSSYANARVESGRWVQDWREYSFADLPLERATELVGRGKRFLEELLQPVNPGYRCIAFRAANWSMHPSRHALEALHRNGLRIDTSVFQHGRREGLVRFDYARTPSHIVPWPASFDDVCTASPDAPIMEFPIYSEHRRLWAFASLNRVYRALLSRRFRVADQPETSSPSTAPARSPSRLRRLTGKWAWKADFNQCTGRQLVGALRRAETAVSGLGTPCPFVLIGHSKLYHRWNARSLEPFFRFAAARPQRFCFGTFGDFPADAFRRN